MLQVCVFGSYDGRLRANKRVFLTLFGGCVLRRSTIARQLLASRAPAQPQAGQRHSAITLFGSTAIKAPTLAEEFIDMQEAIRSGALTLDAWDRCTADAAADQEGTLFSLTLFGSFEEAQLPTEDEEVEGLALQRHLGNMSDSAMQVLQLGVGQDDSHRRAVLRQAAASA